MLYWLSPRRLGDSAALWLAAAGAQNRSPFLQAGEERGYHRPRAGKLEGALTSGAVHECASIHVARLPTQACLHGLTIVTDHVAERYA